MDDERPSSVADEPSESCGLGLLYGDSPRMHGLYNEVRRIANTDVSVFLQGESGTGKELVAQTVHDLSPRRDSVFLPVNCGAFSPSLIESELFGHVRGSFTGATRQHQGCFERASGGTLFLDEITEMQPDLQVKLLRVLETGQLVRLGGETPVSVNVRVLAATNRPLQEAVASGSLREDLYFRLSTFPIEVPALRERAGDVALLARRFLASLNASDGVKKGITERALEKLQDYSWPGNVRELKNLIHCAYILADDTIDIDHFPPLDDRAAPMPRNDTLNVPVGSSLEEVERRLILATLAHYDGDKRRAAHTLGVSLKTIYNRLNRYCATGSEAAVPSGSTGA